MFDRITSQPDNRIVNYVQAVPNIGNTSRTNNLSYRVIYDFITLLYVYEEVISSQTMKNNRYNQLKELFNIRMKRNKDYFAQNQRIISEYSFMKKIIDNL